MSALNSCHSILGGRMKQEARQQDSGMEDLFRSMLKKINNRHDLARLEVHFAACQRKRRPAGPQLVENSRLRPLQRPARRRFQPSATPALPELL